MTEPFKIETPSNDAEEFAVQYREHICPQGVFVRTGEPLEVGTTLRFEYLLADGSVALAGEGRVAWARAAASDAGPAGMGIEVAELDMGKELVAKAAEHRWGEPSLYERGAAEPPAATDATDEAAASAAAPATGAFDGGAHG
ncbi:MAG: hypothetical protein OXT09_12775, partial [Myxococcales bacterium]|nr:hypothetical protein [Myxococcales bacterium]